MIIVLDVAGMKKPLRTHHMCASIDCVKKEDRLNIYTEKFTSVSAAQKAGWRFTNHILFSSAEKKYVWVCSDCWASVAKQIDPVVNLL